MRDDSAYARGSRKIMAAAALLTAVVLFLDFAQDDHLIGLAVAHQLDGYALRAPFDLFRFFDPTRAAYPVNHAWPWFASTDLYIAFFRPLSSLIHTLTFSLAPNQPAIHHAYSWLLYLAAVRAVQQITHRTLAKPGYAGTALMATLMFAIDDGHGLAIGWIAGQNGLGAAMFGLWSVAWKLDAHSRRASLASVVCYGLALLSGEAGVAALPTLLFLSASGPFSERLRQASPYLFLTLLWVFGLWWGGYHTVGSLFYTHPLHEPGAFWINLPQRAGLMLGALFWNLWADPWVASPVEFWLGSASLLLASWLSIVVNKRLGTFKDHQRLRALWWGGLFSTLPFAASDPNERNLVFASAGISIGIGATVFGNLSVTTLKPLLSQRFTKFQWLVLIIHIGLSAIALPMRTCTIDLAFGTVGAQGYRTLEPHGNVIIVNAPDWLTSATVAARRRAERANGSVSVLLSSERNCEATRLDDQTLRMSCPRRLFEAMLSRIVMRHNTDWRAGTSFTAGPMRVTLRTRLQNGEVLDGNQDGETRAIADFTFSEGLDRYRFQSWSNNGYVRWMLPNVGESQVVVGVDRGRSILNEMHRRLTQP